MSDKMDDLDLQGMSYDIVEDKDNKPKAKNKKGNPHSVTMSVKESDPERAKLKAELFNKLWQLHSRRGIAKFKDTSEMSLLIENYFEDCAELGLRPTIRGLASALGTTYNTMNDWENGSRDAVLGSSCSVIIKNAKQFIAQYDELMAVEGIDNPILYMFRAKNYYGMQDKQDISITPRAGIQPELTMDEIRKKLEQDIPIDMDDED